MGWFREVVFVYESATVYESGGCLRKQWVFTNTLLVF